MPLLILVGSQQTVRSSNSDDQAQPSITALNSGGYAVTWTDYSGSLVDVSGSGIKLRIYDENGTATSGEILVNTTLLGSQVEPVITTLTNGNLLVTWTDPTILLLGDNIHGQLFTAAGVAVGGEFIANGGLLNQLLGQQHESAVTALAGGGFVVSWTDGSGNSSSIDAQVFTAGGTKVGDQFQVNTQTANAQQDSAITALANGGFVVTWEDSSHTLGEGGSDGFAVHAQIYDASGTQVGGEFRVNSTIAGNQLDSSVTTLSNGNFVVTWSDASASGGDTSGTAIRGQIYTAAGVAVGGEFLVNTEPFGAQTRPAIADLGDGGFIVVFEDASGAFGDVSGTAIVAQAFDAAGNKVGDDIRINTGTTSSQLHPTVAVQADGSIVVSWETPITGNLAIVSQKLILDAAPTDITIDDSNVPENSGAGTLVGTVTAVDAGGGPFTYALTANAGGRFAVDAATGAITVLAGAGLDFETQASYSITVRATDSGGQFLDKTITIDLTNVDEFPVINGTPGDDVITAPSDDTTTINGGDGDDTLTGAGGNDTLNGGEGDDTLSGMGGNDTINGNGGNDVLDGGTGDDVVDGGTGNDTISGADGNDTLTGGDGNDDLDGGTGTDTLSGGEGDDTLDGGDGNDVVNGNGGNDVLDGGAGDDVMTGGDGDDIFIVDSPGDVVIEQPNGGNDTIVTPFDTTLTENGNIENLTAGSDDDLTLTGNSFDNIIAGAGGDDTISGLGGDDTLTGGAGVDTIDGGTGNDNIDGGDGNDILFGGPGDDVLDGGAGDDMMTGGAGNDTYYVDSAGDVVDEGAGGGNDTIVSTIDYTLSDGGEVENLGAGSDDDLTLTGNAFDNVITGAGGDDTISGLGGNDTLVGGAGDDTIDGGTGNDDVDGGTGNDILVGGAGDDVLDGGAGDDTMTGGTGDDIYHVDSAGDVVNEDAGAGNDRIVATIDYTLSNGGNVENLGAGSDDDLSLTGNAFDNVVTGAGGDDTISGLAGNDTLVGGAGDDVILGGAGDDSIDGGTGADTMSGGTGNDTYYVDDAGDVVSEASGEGADTIVAAIDYTLADDANVETLRAGTNAGLSLTGNAFDNVIIGGGGADMISGLGGDDTLSGGAGDDDIDGGTGNDSIDGGTGADAMTGGAGNDIYYVDNAGDTVTELAGGGNDTVVSSIDYTLAAGGNVENLTAGSGAGLSLTGNELNNSITGGAGADTISGLAGDDTLLGGAGNDAILGGDGNDLINGGPGNDTMTGGLGDDIYYVDSAGDVVVEGNNGGNDTIQTSVDYTLGNDVHVERLVANTTSGLTLIGNQFDNTITGNVGNDTIHGLAGNDALNGGAGADIIYGGANDDVVLGGSGNDTLYGEDGADRLDGGTGADTLTGGIGDDVYIVDNVGDLVVEADGQGYDQIQTRISYTLADTISVERLASISATGVTLTGNQFDNRIDGGAGDDTIYGLGGVDTLAGGGGIDTIYGGDSGDLIYGGDGNDILIGEAGDDRLEGQNGSDLLRGGAGNDIYVVESQADTIEEAAGAGIDTVLANGNYTLSEGVFTEILRANVNTGLTLTGNSLGNQIYGAGGNDILRGLGGTDAIHGGAGSDSLEGGADADQLWGDDGDDTLDGGAANDSLRGGNGADLLIAGAGDDRLDGEAGLDTLRGGAGNDTYVVDFGDVIQEVDGEGIDTVQARGNYTLAAGVYVELLTDISNTGAVLIGNELDNGITGGGGNDTIRGLDGVDSLSGGNGNDTMEGGASNDIVRGDNGDDTLFGNDGDDKLDGGVGNDTLDGGLGNDQLTGGPGSDTLKGGDGNDTYYVEGPIDTIVEAFGGASGSDTIVTSGNYTLSDSMAIEQVTAQVDTGLTLIGNMLDNRLNGKGGADTLRGGGGIDALYGNAGADIIVGGTGRDTMSGGAGADRFVFETVQDTAASVLQADRVADFSGAAGDRIDLAGIDAIAGGGDNSFTLVAAFTHAAGQLISTASGSGFLVQGDVNGDGAADFGIMVTSAAPLTATDFIL